MTNAVSTIKLRSLYIARNSLNAFGFLLLVSAAFACTLAYIEPKGRSGARPFDMLLEAFFFATCGAGLLFSGVWLKLSASLLLVGLALWTFQHDDYRWNNLGLYALAFVPLSLSLWLRYGLSRLGLERLSDAR